MTTIGYKVTDPNGTSFSVSRKDGKKLEYKVGKTVKLKDCEKDGEACGHGIHLARTLHHTLQYSQDTAFSTARFFICEYEKKDVLGEGSDKVRVSKCKVLEETTLDKLELPNADRVLRTIRRVQELNTKKYDTYDESKIVSHTLEHCRRLTALDKEQRSIPITKIRLHSAIQWASVRASVWDSVWDSVRASVWDSVRASVWDSVRASVWDSVRAPVWDSVWDSVVMDDDKNTGLPRIECIIEGGGFFYGVDKEDVAHVIVPAIKDVFRDITLEGKA